jgi:hypothetical protein
MLEGAPRRKVTQGMVRLRAFNIGANMITEPVLLARTRITVRQQVPRLALTPPSARTNT